MQAIVTEILAQNVDLLLPHSHIARQIKPMHSRGTAVGRYSYLSLLGRDEFLSIDSASREVR